MTLMRITQSARQTIGPWCLRSSATRTITTKAISKDDSYELLGTLDHKAAKKYRGQIVMNTEEELFFPTLTVGQTIDFATRMKVPFHLPEGTADSDTFQKRSAEFLLKSMGISHTRDTKVGNEYV